MYDFLHTVDWIVDDPVPVARAFATRFGLPAVRDDFVQDLPSHGYEAVFSRAGVRMPDAPTRLEFIAARPVAHHPGCSVAPIALADRLQGGRAQRTHATVVCATDIEAAVDELRSRGTPVWTEPTCEHLPHTRAWIGWSDGRYVPGYDAGILLELIPTAALGERLVESVTATAAPSTRITRRVHLVADLDEATRQLDRCCALVPTRPVSTDAAIGARVAHFGFRHPAGASFELASPEGDGPASEYFALWGPGPFLTSLVAGDIDDAPGSIVRDDPDLPGIVVEVVGR
jgi:hypothetical protein